VSYQPEERYWTDYVRIATPIVGLLLLLGVFWYWASSLIGSKSDSLPTQPAAAVTVVTQPTPTPTPTVQITLEAQTVIPTATHGATAPSETPGGQQRATETPTAQAAQLTAATGTGFCVGCKMIVKVDNSVRMRSQPSLSGAVIESLKDGAELVVVDATPQQGDGYVWYHVKNETSGNDGWMVQDYLVPAS
jgi:hypothetical protein